MAKRPPACVGELYGSLWWLRVFSSFLGTVPSYKTDKNQLKPETQNSPETKVEGKETTGVKNQKGI